MISSLLRRDRRVLQIGAIHRLSVKLSLARGVLRRRAVDVSGVLATATARL